MRHLLVVPVLLAPAAVSLAGEDRYLYDDLNRLVGVFDATGASAQYTYDAVGNLTSIVRRTPTQVSIIAVSPTSAPVGATVTILGTGFSPTASQNAVIFESTNPGPASPSLSIPRPHAAFESLTPFRLRLRVRT